MRLQSGVIKNSPRRLYLYSDSLGLPQEHPPSLPSHMETVALLDSGPVDVVHAPDALLHSSEISLHRSAWPQFLTDFGWKVKQWLRFA